MECIVQRKQLNYKVIIKAGAETCLKLDAILIDNVDIFVIIK